MNKSAKLERLCVEDALRAIGHPVRHARQPVELDRGVVWGVEHPQHCPSPPTASSTASIGGTICLMAAATPAAASIGSHQAL